MKSSDATLTVMVGCRQTPLVSSWELFKDLKSIVGSLYIDQWPLAHVTMRVVSVLHLDFVVRDTGQCWPPIWFHIQSKHTLGIGGLKCQATVKLDGGYQIMHGVYHISSCNTNKWHHPHITMAQCNVQYCWHRHFNLLRVGPLSDCE